MLSGAPANDTDRECIAHIHRAANHTILPGWSQAQGKPIRVAHCLVGAAALANYRDRFPIFDSRTYSKIASWHRDIVSKHKDVHFDVYLSLDMMVVPDRMDRVTKGARLPCTIVCSLLLSSGLRSIGRC